MTITTVRRTGLALAATIALTALTTLTAISACTSSAASGPSGSAGPFGPSGGRGADTGAGQRDEASRLRSVTALRSAERSTAGAGSARVESTTDMGSLMSMTADGTLAWGDHLIGTLTITYTDGAVADAMRRLGSTSMEARYLPDAYYARVGDRLAARTGGARWLRYGHDDLEDIAGGGAAGLGDRIRGFTPQQCVKLLLASGDVRRVGEERVRGTPATRYSGTVEPARLKTRDPGPGTGRSAELADLKEQLIRAGVTTQTVDVWVDDRGLLVKKVERAKTATGRLTQTAYYADYGVKVTTEAPPAAETQDAANVADGRRAAP
ncbi:hypothetical protein JL475_04975 [Streptomyces sp. M2CJ-2]|uniref:hypothetical protein n=1 Tax=Streptomyces sp. M2CJ-2 TaxID=2803948 RepID=UPI001920D113|nr:hypothetical protein [Streptomyces sp. M2CJ-2]MBL3665363.1 hypothetical protein [Streptomyces sp. M2CJ-2]